MNYLLYLETVGDHTPPDVSDSSSVLSTRMGNWTKGRRPGIDAPDKFGAFILSASNFMESYLLPKFFHINRVLSVDISGVTAWADDHFFSYSWRVDAEFGIGLASDDKVEEFKLKKDLPLSLADNWQNEAKDFLHPLTQSPGDNATIWSYQDIEWGSTAKHDYTHQGSVEVWHSGDSKYRFHMRVRYIAASTLIKQSDHLHQTLHSCRQQPDRVRRQNLDQVRIQDRPRYS